MEAVDIIGILGGLTGLVTAIAVIISNHQKNTQEQRQIDLELEKYARQSDLDEQKQDLGQLRAIIEELRIENTRYREDKENYMTRLAQLEIENKELSTQLGEKNIEINKLQRRIEEQDAVIKQLRIEIEQVRGEIKKDSCE